MLKYSYASWTELRQSLPDRSKDSIELKAFKLGLTRAMYATTEGLYTNYGVCSVHGRILKSEIIWERKGNLNIPRCSKYRCRRRLRLLPRSSKLRERYRR